MICDRDGMVDSIAVRREIERLHQAMEYAHENEPEQSPAPISRLAFVAAVLAAASGAAAQEQKPTIAKEDLVDAIEPVLTENWDNKNHHQVASVVASAVLKLMARPK